MLNHFARMKESPSTEQTMTAPREKYLKAVVFIKSIEAMQILPSKTPSIPNEAKIRTKK
jgi:hypothetical protein